MDRYGLLPPVIRHNYEREEMVDRQLTAAISIHRALTALDPRLDLVYVSDRADPEYGVKPGRWHVVRKNDPPTPDLYIPIETEDGGYRQPDFGVVHEMQRRDTWTHGTPELKNTTPTWKKEKKKDEQAVDELVSDVRAAWRLPGEGGMTKRLWGKGRK